MNPRSFRTIAALAVSALALTAAGCKSKCCGGPEPVAQMPCAPPACEPPPCAPAPCAPAPCAPPSYGCGAPSRAVASMPTPPPMVAQPPVIDADAKARLETMRTAIDAKTKHLADMEAQLAAQEAKSGPATAAPRGGGNPGAEDAAHKLAEELKGMPGAQVMVEGSNTVVIVTDSFGSGSDKLKSNPDLRAALKATSQAMARHPEAKVSVIGHTDSAPITKSSWESNVALSRARAEAVARAMAADGASRDRMRVDGVGANDPLVSPETTSSAKAKNRRVEIEFAFGSPPASPAGN